jgi:hypothetical protein
MAKPDSEEDQQPAPDYATSLTHIYGLLSLVPSFIGITVAIKQSTELSQWLLLASGWIASIFLAVFLIYLSKQFSREVGIARLKARRDGVLIGKFEERVEDLTAEINRRHATLDYLSGLLVGTRVTPRQTTAAVTEPRDDNGENR